MREILFRGKRLDNGEWVEGDFIAPYFISPYKNSELYINGTYVNEKSVDGIVWCQGSFYRIAPSTVGQYTGLKDKNGERIFEGDILLVDGEDGYFKLEFDEDTARFIMLGDSILVDFDNFWSYEVEIIGNVLDNPELLEK